MNVLIIAAHPDDETLGCGGAIAKHARLGDTVEVLVFADGVTARAKSLPEALKARGEDFKNACRILGVSDYVMHQYSDNRLDMVPLLDLVKYAEIHIERFKPEIVYTHHEGDLNVDHSLVCKAVRTACRPQPGCSVKKLLHFEVPCSTAWGGEFQPNYFVELDAELLAKKLTAFSCYDAEIRDYPHPRSKTGLNDLAHWRGAAVGLRAAEAFVVGRTVA